MNKQEATELLQNQLAVWRQKSHRELAASIGQPDCAEVLGASGAVYQVEVEAFWDGQAGEDIRVLGSIDDGGWRALVPLCADFILRPDGSFVGEDAG
jgi:hypothetical protein